MSAKRQAGTKAGAKAASQQVKYYKALVPFTYVQQGEEKRGWTEVGIGFPSKDGKGVNVELRPGISVSGRLVLRPVEPKDDGEADEGDAPMMPGRFVHPAVGDPNDLF